MKFKILPYKVGSKSARALAQALGGVVVSNKPRRSWIGSSNLVVRWGNDNPIDARLKTIKGKAGYGAINNPEALLTAKHKLRTFDALVAAGVNCPVYTTDAMIAHQWINEGPVLLRSTATGQGGAGIIYIDRGQNDRIMGGQHYPNMSPNFVVKYIKKIAEYRVHVFDGEVIRVQEKRRQTGFEGRNNQVRNHANGWVFCTENVIASDALKDIAIKAVGAVGLTFGAVDVIYNERQDAYYVLEINTAPGLEGETVNAYANAIRNYSAKLEETL